MDSGKEQSAPQNEGGAEVTLVFRHFHPILAGAAERFRRYSLPLRAEGVRYRVFTLREEEGHAEEERLHETLFVRRLRAEGKPWVRDAALFEAAWRQLSVEPAGGRVLQTSLAHDLATPWLNRIQRRGIGCLYVGTMVGKPDTSIPKWRQWIQKWKSWRNYKPFHRVVASTTVMARWFEACGVAAAKIEVIPNGVDVSRFSPADSPEAKRQLRERLGLPAGAPVAVFIGSIVPRKGVELLIRSWPAVLARQPDAQLVLVGGFDRPTFMTQERIQELSRFQEGVRSQAALPECGGSIRFAGESAQVEDWLRAADVFVFPTEQEGMGNVVLEAMACGLPSVITEFHGLPTEEFGVAGRHFILTQRTAEALAEGLVRTLSEPGTAAAMGAAARDWACATLDVRLTIARYAKLYHQLAHH